MKVLQTKNQCIPSHLSFSDAPHDSHFPASRGNPRNGFPSWLGWVTGHSFTEYVHFRNQKKKLVIIGEKASQYARITGKSIRFVELTISSPVERLSLILLIAPSETSIAE
jgi:hypothetical protein